MKIHIKYMVSNRCKMAVKEVLKKLELHFVIIDLGEVDIMEDLSVEQKDQLRTDLLSSGFELMEDKKAILIDRIKNACIEMVYNAPSDDTIKTNFSDYLSEKLGHDYTYLSNIFTEVHGSTIEQFIIALKIERIKEFIIYDELTITEIAWKMNYSSVAHLSNQFKKHTGMAPSEFKKLKVKKRNTIDDIENSNEINN
ncbi:MAG: AraC family transcriptional regulator [Bacteroidota bacterium]